MHCLAASLVLPLVASALYMEVGGSMNKETSALKNSKYNFGYQGNGVYPGGIVYTVRGYYPVGAGGGYPGTAGRYPAYPESGVFPSGRGDEDPVSGGDGGKIPGGVPVDDEVEVFNVPRSQHGGYPRKGHPSGGYPGFYPGVYAG